MFNLSITSNGDTVFSDLRAGLASTPKRMTARVTRDLIVARPRIVSIVAVEPPERTGGERLRGMTKRQRRAFYATNGFGRGIPTFRTHATAHLWDITHTVVHGGGQIDLLNSSAYADYVVGDDQQPFHADQGWRTVDTQANLVTPIVQNIVLDAWDAVSDPYAAVGATA